jgi:hypothetical protein
LTNYTKSQLEDVVLALLDDEQMLRRYTEELEKEGLATLPLRSILADITQIRMWLKNDKR